MQDGLAHRLFEGEKKPGERRYRKHVPNANGVEIDHYAEKKRHEQECALRDDENSAPVGAIHDGTAQRGKNDAGQPQAKTVEPKKERGVCELKNQPCLGRSLDQTGGVTQEKAPPEDGVISMAKGAESLLKKHHPVAVAKS
jgi:hypothetical protein